MVDHRVHVAGADAEEQSRPTKPPPVIAGVPIGLGDDAHPKASRLEHAAKNAHGKARVIDISVARHDHDVQFVPTSLLGLLHRHGERDFGDGARRSALLRQVGQKLIG